MLLLQLQESRPVMVTRYSSRYTLNISDAKDRVSAFTLHIIDTPGLVEAGAVNYHVLDNIKRSIFPQYSIRLIVYITLTIILLAEERQ